MKSLAETSTVGSHLSEHIGTKGCSDNWNVLISDPILIVYKVKIRITEVPISDFQLYEGKGGYSCGADRWWPRLGTTESCVFCEYACARCTDVSPKWKLVLCVLFFPYNVLMMFCFLLLAPSVQHVWWYEGRRMERLLRFVVRQLFTDDTSL